MRAVIFLAIVGVAFGNLCKGVSKADFNAVKAAARTGAATILGASCPSFDIDTVAFSGECAALVKQATCYGLKAAKRYDVAVVDYGLLARDVKNMAALGNLACADVAGCFAQVRGAIQTCMTENANFVQQTIEAAEALYKKDYEAQVMAFAEDKSGSLLGDLASMALDQFSSADDIRTFIESQITDEVVEDAKAAGAGALEMAQYWCENDCTSSSAGYLKGLFGHMNGGGCDDASVFCGPCADRASKYFADNTLPCCIENVIQKGIKAYNHVVKNYSDELMEYAEAIRAQLSETAIAEAEAARDSFVEQFDCVKDVYSGVTNKPTCA